MAQSDFRAIGLTTVPESLAFCGVRRSEERPYVSFNADVRVESLCDSERPHRSELRLVGQVFANTREIDDRFDTS